MLRFIALCFDVCCNEAGKRKTSKAFRGTSLPVSLRLKDLVNRLTIEEKISLLMETAPAIPRLNIKKNFIDKKLYYLGRKPAEQMYAQIITDLQ